MLLVADIGNTSTTVGVYNNDKLIHTWRINTNKNNSEDEYGILLYSFLQHKNLLNDVRHAVISSVVLPLTSIVKSAIENYLNVPVLALSHSTETGIILNVEKPKDVGCDRIANACAGYNLYANPAVIIDLGTATTFDVVVKNEFIGGIISPGLRISAESLSSFTNLLPKLKIAPPANAIGKNTIDNMLNGVVRGHSSMIDGLVESIELELGEKITTIATGGYLSLIKDYLKRPFDYTSPYLTLEGLRIIHNLNCK